MNNTTDFDEGYTADPTVLAFELYIHGFAIIAVGLVGLAGSGLCLSTLASPCFRNSSVSIVLRALAVVDMTVIVGAVILFSFPIMQVRVNFFLHKNK